MAENAQWILLGFPISALAFGLIGYFWLRHLGRKFDEKYGDTSTPGE